MKVLSEEEVMEMRKVIPLPSKLVDSHETLRAQVKVLERGLEKSRESLFNAGQGSCSCCCLEEIRKSPGKCMFCEKIFEAENKAMEALESARKLGQS